MRKNVALGDLKPNPYRKFVRGGKLEENKIAKLVGSIEDNKFWDRLVGRETDDGIEIAFGHHVTAAGKKVKGKSYVTSIQIEDLSDADMLRMLAAENGTNETDSVAAQVDIVLTVRKGLLESRDAKKPWCKFLSAAERNPKANGRPHECGSEPCIAAFLDSAGNSFSQTKVHELLTLAEKLSPGILDSLTNRSTHPERGLDESGEKVLISAKGALALAALPIPAQKQVMAEIKKGGTYLPADRIKAVVATVQPQLKKIEEIEKPTVIAAKKEEKAAKAENRPYVPVAPTAAVKQAVATITETVAAKAVEATRAVQATQAFKTPSPKIPRDVGGTRVAYKTKGELIVEFWNMLSPEVRKAAWRSQAALFHPDAGGDAAAASKFNSLWSQLKT